MSTDTRARTTSRRARRLRPAPRVPWVAAGLTMAIAIALLESTIRHGEGQLAAAIAQNHHASIELLDIGGEPHLAFTRGHTWNGFALHPGQTAALWIAAATAAAALSMTLRCIRPARLATLAAVVTALVTAAAQATLQLQLGFLAAGTRTEAAASLGIGTIGLTAGIATGCAIALSVRRPRRRTARNGNHRRARRRAPRTRQTAPSALQSDANSM